MLLLCLVKLDLGFGLMLVEEFIRIGLNEEVRGLERNEMKKNASQWIPQTQPPQTLRRTRHLQL